ncbi:hypothetical protein C8R45DRAFT_391280 [Mycena sanguinolenta]|nr:hypothetical protein C8R45DRAFT_391280 [Mycena sanguinolenta]
MAPRAVVPQKKNRARCGIKYPLRIVKGDLAADSEYIDEDLEEAALQLTADVDANEGNEHHLQAALATKAVFIPTPGSIRVVDNYEELYPLNKWADPISYLKTTQTCEEACSNALDHEFTYFMDEIDKQWLDKNNQQARGEGTSAQGARPVSKGKAKSPEMGVPVSISEDEFELVMGLLEKITDEKFIPNDGLDFSLYEHVFLKPLSADMFASYVTPSWIPPPPLLVRIARTVYPHWEQRRSLLKGGRRLRPALNFDESDLPNESYICFRRRDNKPVRKTRAGQAANNADKLVQLDQNLSQALDIANALLARENVKQAAAVQYHNVWRARQPMADLLRKFPSLLTKADEERLVEKPRKVKPPRSSLPKVKVLPPSHPGTPSAAPAAPQATLPSERCAGIQQEIMKTMHKGWQELKDHCQVDAVDDPYQPRLIPRAEKMWVDVPMPPPQALASQADQPVMRANQRAVRLRYGRGGRRFLDRRSTSHPYLPELHNHRRHAEDLDEETTRRLHGQWRFDADCTLFGPPEENRELVDEYDTRFLAKRLAWVSKDEAALVTDASLAVHGHDLRILPEYFTTNVALLQEIYQKPSLSGYLAEEGIRIARTFTSAAASPRSNTPAATVRATAAAQKPTPVSTPSTHPSPHPRAQAPMRPPAVPAQPRMQENISPQRASASAPSTRPAPASPVPPRMQENTSLKSGSSSPSPVVQSPVRPRTYVTLPHNPNPIVPRANGDAVKSSGGGGGAQGASVNVNVNVNARPAPGGHGQSPQTHPLQTNGARTGYVPLSTGTNTLKLPSRAPSRPSPLATHSVVVSSSPSRASDS